MNRATTATPKACPSCGTRYTTDALFCPNDGTPLVSGSPRDGASAGEIDPYVGREISGHIEVRQLVGIGAMGRVYRALQRGIDRDVAVKVLHRELSANQQLVTRFHREAKVASRLQHPNVVQVHLSGQLPDGAMYIVMEYLDGLSLQSALAAAGEVMPLSRALHIGLQICDAVGEAHAQGIVHRDLKPENVMLVKRGDDPDYVKVLDFGIARLNWGEQSMATAAGLIFGTARYISPEGAQGEAAVPQSDVYAVATLLYQLLAGRTPFEGDQAVALLVQQIHDKPPPLKSLARAAEVPDAIAEVIMQNLAKSPTERAEDARALGRLLVDAAKASGLPGEELLSRSALLGGRPSHAPSSPVQPTKRAVSSPSHPERVSAETRLGTPSPVAVDVPPPRTIAIAPATKVGAGGGVPDPAPSRPTMLSPGAAAVPAGSDPVPAASTTKWAVPPDLQAQLAPAKSPTASGVDPTLDDDDGTVPPPPLQKPSSPRVQRTEFSPGPDQASVYASGATMESPARVVVTPAPAPSQLKPTMGIEAATLEDGPDSLPRRSRSRQAVVIFLCFLLGVALASAVLYRMGRIGPAASGGTLDDYVARAGVALRQERWDAPPHDNVRDITSEGLTKWPRDPRLLDIRARATDELVKAAMGAKFTGDLKRAQHLARLANELDATDTTAQHLVAELDQEARLQLSTDPAVPITLDAGGGRAPSRSGATTGGLRATLDVSVAKPQVGQPVTFLARIGAGPKARTEDVHFRLDGPGLAPDTRLTALTQGTAAFQTAFTFFEAGKYEVSFNARIDGTPIKVTRSVTVEDAQNQITAPPATSPPPLPDAGKWL